VKGKENLSLQYVTNIVKHVIPCVVHHTPNKLQRNDVLTEFHETTDYVRVGVEVFERRDGFIITFSSFSSG